MSSDDTRLLRTRNSDECDTNDTIHLFSSHEDTNQYNWEKLNSIPTDHFDGQSTYDGLVNGATGLLREIGFSTSNTPKILWVQFLG